VSATAPSTTNVTIKTTGSLAKSQRPFLRNRGAGIAVAVLLPFGSLLAFPRKRFGRRTSLQILGACILSLTTAGFVLGCSSSTPAAPPSSSTPAPTPTPTGMQQVTITATSGSITQTATVNLTIQ
jgi:hypothetical protein